MLLSCSVQQFTIEIYVTPSAEKEFPRDWIVGGKRRVRKCQI
jgi:hypothetical protein